MRKKIFITGIGGLTGYKLSLLAKKKYDISGSYNLRDPNLKHVNSIKVDLADFETIKKILNRIHPDVLINTAAISNVDYCESHKKEAELINVGVVNNLYQICNSLGIKLIHISSDSVFDGTKTIPYSEEDEPNPINYYGQTKLASEKIALQNSNNVIVRASVLYGWLPKFMAEKTSSSMKAINFGQWLIFKLIANECIKIVTDEISSPIIADDLANSIFHLIEKDESGVFHCAPQIQISRFDFSIKLAKFFNFDVGLIQPTTVKELGRNVPTGVNKCLDSKKISKTTGFSFIGLEESLILIKEQMKE